MEISKIQRIAAALIYKYDLNCIVDGDLIIIKEEYEMGEDEKNSDDCCDAARETGEFVIEKFPMLEIDEYYCHRNKYAIVHLKLKNKIKNAETDNHISQFGRIVM